MNALLCVLVLPVLGGPLGNTDSEGKRPSVQELVGQVQSVDSRSKQVRSIEISATSHTKGGVDLDYHLSYEAPDHCRFSIRDSHDGTPLLLYSEHRMMIYDGRKATVCYSESSSLEVNFPLDIPEDSLYDYKIRFGEETTPARVLCAFPKVLAAGWKSRNVRMSSNGIYNLTCLNEKGDRLEAIFDEEKPDPLVFLEIIPHGEERASIAFSEIAVNEPVHHPSFRFPDRDDLAAAGLRVIDLDHLGVLSFLRARASFPRAFTPRASRKDTAKRDVQISRALRTMTLPPAK